MDDEPSCDSEFTAELTTNADDGGSAPYAGAFFPSSQHLHISGGVFTSNVTSIHQAAPNLRSDFRMIPLGDVDLRKEIRLDSESGLVYCQSGRRLVRRMYAARICGVKSDMTVVQYQGDKAEEEWRKDILKYSRIRHPNFVQLYGAASSNGIYATIFHDDLIPFTHVLELYRHSHFATVYIWAYSVADYWAAENYFRLTQQCLFFPNCKSFIRRSTGRLCEALCSSDGSEPVPFNITSNNPRVAAPETISTLTGSIPKAIVISSLTLGEYHGLCYYRLRRQRKFLLASSATARLGALISLTNTQLERLADIAFMPCPTLAVGFFWKGGETGTNGWTRYNACDVFGSELHHGISLMDSGDWIFHPNLIRKDGSEWLSQANHIFRRLRITSNYIDYALVQYILFTHIIPATPPSPPEGYLFVCPQKDFQSGPGSFRWPDYPAYWSLDPSGIVRLSAEEATELGFPAIGLRTEVQTTSWDESVYAGLRAFHQAKGFDPDSPDVALHLEYPLLQLSDSEADIPFAHVEADSPETESLQESGAPLNDSFPKTSPGPDSLLIEKIPSMVDAELPEPTMGRKIVMCSQFALILTTLILWLHDLCH